MDLRTKRALDHRIGQPALSCLSPVVRLLGMLLGRSHGVLPVRTVVVLKFQGMGSIAIARSAIARVRARFPEASLPQLLGPSPLPSTSKTDRMVKLLDQAPASPDQKSTHDRGVVHCPYIAL